VLAIFCLAAATKAVVAVIAHPFCEVLSVNV
jgi:hypothetical protein